MNKAVFYDRDGTLIKDIHYLSKVKDVEFFDDAIDVLKKIQDLGYMQFIVTNQSGIGRGFFSKDDMHAVHSYLLKTFVENDITIKEIVYCPHTPDDQCNCRKPSPYLIEQLIEKYHIDRKHSIMIGDKVIDKQSGENAGIKGVTLTSQYTEKGDFNSLSEFLESLKD